MFKALICSAMLVSGALAHADWNGTWAGEGMYSNDLGDKDAMEMEVLLTETATSLTLEDYWSSYEFVIENGILMLDGQTVGAITADMIDAKFPDSYDATCTQTFHAGKTATGVDYVNDYSCTDGYFDRFEGSLVQ